MKSSLSKCIVSIICCLLVVFCQVSLASSGFHAHLVSGSVGQTSNEDLPVLDNRQPGDEARYSVAILPQMELLTAVQTQTTWMDRMGPGRVMETTISRQ